MTLFTTVGCGAGHVASSILIGFAGIALGYSIAHIEGVEVIRGSIAAWAFLIFGLAYMTWGIVKAAKNKPHTHSHSHPPTFFKHKKTQLLTPWVLFIIFVLGPCEILIPLVMIPAADHNTDGIIAVSLLFSITTILTMCAAVTIGYYGFKFLPADKIDRYMHAIAGATICISGLAILFFDL